MPDRGGATAGLRLRTATTVSALALLCALSGCATGEDVADDASGGKPSATATAPAPTASAGGSAPASGAARAPATAAGRTIAVSYAGGRVTGVHQRVEVPLGEAVVVRVTSDVTEEVHVHGYDRKGDVPAGGTVDIAFTADIPGVFEVELEELGKTLFQLRVA